MLKDTDFKNLENKLQIDEEIKPILMKQIFEDVRFFAQQGIIDYSMILYKSKITDPSEDLLSSKIQIIYSEVFDQTNEKKEKKLNKFK